LKVFIELALVQS